MKIISIKKISVVVVAWTLLLASFTSSAWAKKTGAGLADFGAGIILGEPTGLTFKYWKASTRAIDGGFAYSANEFLLLYADHLWHFPAFSASLARSSIQPYLGLGGVFFISNRSHRTDQEKVLGVRIPFGAEWKPGAPPLGVFVELVPGLGIIPATYGLFQGGIGARYYF